MIKIIGFTSSGVFYTEKKTADEIMEEIAEAIATIRNNEVYHGKRE